MLTWWADNEIWFFLTRYEAVREKYEIYIVPEKAGNCLVMWHSPEARKRRMKNDIIFSIRRLCSVRLACLINTFIIIKYEIAFTVEYKTDCLHVLLPPPLLAGWWGGGNQVKLQIILRYNTLNVFGFFRKTALECHPLIRYETNLRSTLWRVIRLVNGNNRSYTKRPSEIKNVWVP